MIHTPDPAEARLLAAILALKTPNEVRDFLADLCTPAEVRAFIERLEQFLMRHRDGSIVALSAAAWIVTASRP